MSKRIYISGPMSGLPDFNYPAFEAAANRLRERGLVPVSPTETGQHDDWTWGQYMRAAIALQATCDEVYMLRGWQDSRGANVELQLAHGIGQRIHWQDEDHA